MVDATALQGLAHPLRVRLLDELSVHGPATATTLGRRLGESSGATSYHLRQLERHGFIEEDPDRGSGRERWWRTVPGGVTMHGHLLRESPATREAANLVLGEMMRSREERHRNWVLTYQHWPAEWVEASVEQTAHLRMRPEEMAALRDEVDAVVTAWSRRLRGREAPDLVDVELQVNLFPVADPDGDVPGAPPAATDPGRTS
ncbi:helix-turn-helix domain-containing protein [Thalassiella azotivora]